MERAAAAKDVLLEFDPQEHVEHQPPKYIWTMADFGFPIDTGISSVAVSGPFKLFSESAILKMRRELLGQNPPNCQVNVEGVGKHMRGMVPGYAKFNHNLWTHPEVLSHISEIAGLDLIPVMDTEISQVNVLYPEAKATSSVNWHRSSFPFVCVVMLSNMDGTKGGETCFRGPSCEIKTMDTFPMGWVYLLQGLHVEHMIRPFTAEKNRVTVITSFRPLSPYIQDKSTVTAIRPISDPGRLYSEFCEYRLRNARFLLLYIAERFQKEKDPESAKLRVKAVTRILQNTSDELAEEIRAPVEETESWTPEKMMLYAAERFKNMEEEVQQNRSENLEFDTEQMIFSLGGTKNFLLRLMEKLSSDSSWL